MSSLSLQPGSQLVILHRSLNDSEIHRILRAQPYKIKVSTGTVKNTCIFPQSTAAFMILPAVNVLSQTVSGKPQICQEIAANLTMFSELRHKCYVFLLAPLISSTEQKILNLLQEEYMHTDLSFLPAHNSSECAECIFSIARVLCKPLSAIIRDRFERLRDQVCSEENILLVLAEFGIDSRTGMYLLDGCGGLAGVVRATARGELTDYNVSSSLIASIEQTLTASS